MLLKFTDPAPHSAERVIEAREYRVIYARNQHPEAINVYVRDQENRDREILFVISKAPEDWDVCYITGADGATVDVLRAPE